MKRLMNYSQFLTIWVVHLAPKCFSYHILECLSNNDGSPSFQDKRILLRKAFLQACYRVIRQVPRKLAISRVTPSCRARSLKQCKHSAWPQVSRSRVNKQAALPARLCLLLEVSLIGRSSKMETIMMLRLS